MNPQQNEQFNLNNALRVFLQGKWLIFFCLFDFLLLAVIFNLLSTSIYKSDIKIVFEERNGPTASTDPFEISLNERYIVNQTEEIKSRSLIEEVVEALPIDVINTFPLPERQGQNFNKKEYIVKQIQKRTSTIPVIKSDVIKIDVEAYSPIAAKVIANTIAEVFINRHLKVNRAETRNVRKIIEEQLANSKRKLDDSEIRLKMFQEQFQITDISKEAEEIFNTIRGAESRYIPVKADLEGAKNQLRNIQDKLTEGRKKFFPTITKNTARLVQILTDKLVGIQSQYTALQVEGYPEDHSKILKLKEQIEETKNNLEEECLKIEAGENVVEPLSQIQGFIERSIALEIEIQMLQAQEKTLREIINTNKRKLSTLPDKEIQLTQLLRDKEINERRYKMLIEKREETKIAEAEIVGNVRIFDPAKINNSPVKPRRALNLIMAIILGSAIGIGLAFLFEFWDNSVKTVEEAEQITGLSVLGTIPKIRTSIRKAIIKNLKKKKGKKVAEMISNLVTIYIPKSPESETFRALRTKLQLSRIVSPLKTILITSANPCEGKSFIAANLSITAAQMGLKTLLIDTDVKRPTLHVLFQKKREPGLVNTLTSKNSVMYKANNPIPVKERKNRLKNFDINNSYQGNQTRTNLEQALLILNSKNSVNQPDTELLMSSIKHNISSTHIANLDLLTCGSIPTNPSKVLASKDMKNIILELRNQYDIIFIDTLPINIFPDAVLLSSIVDGSVLVIKAGSTAANEILDAKELLIKAQSKIIGLVVNCLDSHTGYSKYYYYYVSNNNNHKKAKKRKEKLAI